MSRAKTRENSKKRSEVAIFGGGIAGLTAAHELIERGFRVEVYEKTEPSRIDQINGAPCALGGMARTQWGRIDRPRTVTLAPRMKRVDVLTSKVRAELDAVRINFKQPTEDEEEALRDSVSKRRASGRSRSPLTVSLDAAQRGTIKEVLKILARDSTIGLVEVRGFCSLPIAHPYDGDWEGRIDFKRAEAVTQELRTAFRGKGIQFYPAPAGFPENPAPEDLLDLLIARLGAKARARGGETERRLDYVSFRVIEDYVPGEHGFRFFPRFYRHVHDTMRRTPIAREDTAFRETGRTVLDNILPTEFQRISHTDLSKSFQFHRRPPRSLHEMFEYQSKMLRSMEASPLDFSRLQRFLFKYMTSCSERRAAECEDITWFEYIRGREYSESFQRHMDRTGQLLVAMTAREADARSFGNNTVQLLIDQVQSEEGVVDGTLSGPTSVAWFEPWRRYLERQGVDFYCGELVRFEVAEDGAAVPIVNVVTPEAGTRSTRIKTAIVRDYYVVATDLVSAQEILNQKESRGLRGGDYERIRRFAEVNDVQQAKPRGPLRHMSGIQFYFDSEIPFVHGHTDYADSAWALTSISQPQFWTQRLGWWSGYRGVLSVDICDFHSPGKYTTTKCAWDCKPDELAEEVWRQITVTLEKDKGPIPDPIYYHIDDTIVFRDNERGVASNESPYLINLRSQYRERPGVPGAYKVQPGKIVFAGTYMRTYTRITTMEAANESARHAVNAILEDAKFEGRRCDTFNSENYELDDLKDLLELDSKLYRDGLPHFLEVLSPDDLPTDILRRSRDLAALLRPFRPIDRPLVRRVRKSRA
jgi:uncharacterized protein with NAD-binding domain and iron-sulfur cluster